MVNKYITRWITILIGPILSLIAFVVTYYIDPLKFGTTEALSALPAFLLSIIILMITQNITNSLDIEKHSEFSDRIYEAVKNYLHVTIIGSPEVALKYINDRIPVLSEVKNTSFNIIGETERADEKFYDSVFYQMFIDNIAKYCHSSLMWKDIGDRLALARFRTLSNNIYNSVSDNSHKRYKYRLTSGNEPQINFIILEYNNGDREVLFNWDYRKIGIDPLVLISRDSQIIEMFAVQFYHLWKSASEDHDNTANKSTQQK